MIKSLGPGLDSTDFIRIALGSQHTFIVVQNSNLSKPLVIPWPVLLQQIQAQLNISSTSTIDVRDEGAIIDATAQFLNFVGAGVTVTQNGNGVDITIPGGGGSGILVALPFATDHISATGNPYLIGDVVWYLGNIYRCIASNDSIIPTNTLYWTNLGPGYPLVQQPSDWNATSGNNQILNKPTIPLTIVEDVTATAPIISSGGTTPNVSTSMNTNKLIGRGTAGVGVMEEITLGTGLSLSGTTLNASATTGDSISPFLLMGG